MSTTTSPIDRDVLAELRRGDERALERLFRERFADLSAEARAELDVDGSSAPRVVEDAFLSAWKARAHFETPESLDAFLHERVHMNAVRERSRRAALHRFEAHGHHAHAAHHHAPANVDEAWRHVATILHAPEPDAASHVRVDVSRHEAAEHVKAIARRPPWVWPTVVALVLGVAMFLGLRWVDRTSVNTAITKALASPDARAFASRAGQRASITLGDRSQVTLGSESRLIVVPNFNETLRAVKLDGTAAFTVASNPQIPFTVRAGAASIVATGTVFDVAAYSGGPNAGTPPAMVRVRDGSVTVTAGNESRALKAGEAVLVDGDGRMTVPTGVAVNEALGWTSDRFVVANRPLREALPLVARWYDTRLIVKDSALLARPVNIDASISSSREAIAGIEKSANLVFGWEDRTMVLRDAGTPAPAKK
jgi:ferric-dicitrate binding protein FerR (iron transport regulator)